jgi:hypothetical protein
MDLFMPWPIVLRYLPEMSTPVLTGCNGRHERVFQAVMRFSG